MALVKTLILENNFEEKTTFRNAYIKVESISGSKENMVVKVIYLKQKDEIKVKRKDFSFIPDLNGANFIKQAYEHLKTLPEFADAEDC